MWSRAFTTSLLGDWLAGSRGLNQPGFTSVLMMSDPCPPELTLLYDGGCPLCLREVHFLQRRDRAGRIAFVDIDAVDYNPDDHQGISYRAAMGRIHALTASGEVLIDVAVFREAYRLIGLGWLYAPTGWPLLDKVVNGLYGLWAQQRLNLTGRPDLDQLCRDRCELTKSGQQ